MSGGGAIFTLRGTLTIITGCMFSGKTTELLRLLGAYSSSQVLAAKHASDLRYHSHAIVSHGGLSRDAVPLGSADELLECLISDHRVVGIDEAHFFDAQIVTVIRAILERGIDVVVAALDRDSWGRSFRVVDELVEMADTPVSKAGICARCGAEARRTQRTTPIVNRNMVGGVESFEPRCHACWHPPPEDPPPQ